MRAISFATGHDRHYRDHKDKLKPDVIWNIEKAYELTGLDIVRANAVRNRMVQSHAAFFQTYDLLLSPATIVQPFAITMIRSSVIDADSAYPMYAMYLCMK